VVGNFFFVTGTGTAVGKTVFAALFAAELHRRGLRAAALKPVCSGGRADALQLWRASGRLLTLDQVNPWHLRAPLAPVLAARREGRRLHLAEVLQHIRQVATGFETVLVEGAGGLLSPMGEDFDSLDLVVQLKAAPFVVGQNKLGAVNQVRLVLNALPKRFLSRTHVILFDTKRACPSASSNVSLLSEYFPAERIHRLPWLTRRKAPLPRSARKTLARIAQSCFGSTAI
jgi:dethiobiotin synthetase